MGLNLFSIGRFVLRGASSAPEVSDFDPVFYRQYYGDLHHLKSAGRLQRHYVSHGMREGRGKNLAEVRARIAESFGPLPTDFHTHAYRELNEDLARVFDYEWQFEFHYLEHGRKEGRRYKFEEISTNEQPLSWERFFRLADFVACGQNWLAETPETKEQAIRLFLDAGIDHVAPINLDLVFDPDFYRSAYGFAETTADATLYRHWLDIGILKGLSPNEEKALQNIVVSRLYPRAFDWRNYRSALPKAEAKALRHRVDVLRHLFNTGFENGATAHIAGEGAAGLFAEIGDFHLIRGHHRIAISAYDFALKLEPSLPGVRHRRGDAHRGLGAAAAAQTDYIRAAVETNAPVWSTVHAARLAAANGSFERSFDILRDARGTWEKSVSYRNAVTELIEEYFNTKSRSAMALYESCDREIADAYMTKSADEVRVLIEDMETLPSAIPPNPNGQVAILANQDLVQCRHYRVEQKARQLRRAGITVEVFDQNDIESFIRSLVGARAAIFYRTPAFPKIIKAILTAKALGVPTFYEIDDLIFDSASYPDTLESYEGQISRAEYNGLLYGVSLFRYAMSLCDRGIASTQALADQMVPIVRSKACFVLRNGLDERNENAITMGSAARPERNVVTIFYGSGTKAHNSDFNELAAPGLLFVLERYAHVRLVIVGHLPLRIEFERFSSRITRLGFMSDLDQYWSLLAAADINIAVLSPGPMADCKSEIKWLEAAVLQVPSIVSATATYQQSLTDGVDAIIVGNDSSAWTKALTRLIEEPNLRHSVGRSARRKALEEYSLDSAAHILREQFTAATAVAAPDLGKSKIKVLICAVFFPPQSYGGATRVVQDNVDFMIDEYPDIQLSAFTTDEGVSPEGLFRLDQYRGVPVFRISTPIEPNMDWRPFNVERKEIFLRILEAVDPDLIHFHCIQRLTATIVEVAVEREIPYVITVHDGWWISDYQFLVDNDDILRLPSPDVYDVKPPPGISLAESASRRQRLAHLLGGAAQVIAVSDSFADIYRRAGCRNIVSIPNGVSQIEPVPKRKSLDGRLSLGHIGGRSAHKGAMLVEAVFRMNKFDNLKLTMMDFSMRPGTHSDRIWGNTPVTLCGAVPQEEIAELYASLDVLLAPSIWPESFGLVAREALSQGLWVVASNRGAVSEDITPGENGFIIDVATGRGLADVLRILDANILHYQSQPRRSAAPMRKAADQSKELAELYRGLKISRKYPN